MAPSRLSSNSGPRGLGSRAAAAGLCAAVALAGAALFGAWSGAEVGPREAEALGPPTLEPSAAAAASAGAALVAGEPERQGADPAAPLAAWGQRAFAPLDPALAAAPGSEPGTFLLLVLEQHPAPRPVAGARLTLQRGREVLARAETDALGRAAVAAPASLADVLVESDHHVDSARSDVRAGVESTFALVPSGSLVGRVEYAGRRGLAEQEVRLWTGTGRRGGRGERTAAVDPSGAFQFTDLAPGYVTVALAADDEPLAHEPSVLIRSGAEARVTLRVPEARRLTGRVVTAESRAPLDGVTVRARQVVQGAAEVSRLGREGAVTGRDGGFVLEPLAPARVVVSAETPWGGRAELELDLTDPALPPVELAVPAAIALEGRAVDAAGRGVPGARIIAVHADGAVRVDWRAEAGPDGATPERNRQVLARTVADGAGQFRFAALPPESRLVLAALAEDPKGPLGLPRDGRLDVRTRRASDPADPVRITLKGAATVSGRVVDGQGSPLEGVQVTPRGQDLPLARVNVRTALDGTFVAACAAGAAPSLDVRCEGFLVLQVAAEAAAPSPEGFRFPQPIVLEREVRLSGLVRDPAGNAVRATVEARRLTRIRRDPAQAWSDRLGRFSFGGLVPGVYEVSARATGYRAADPAAPPLRIEVPTDEPITLVLVPEPLPPRGAVAGEVVVFGTDDPVPRLAFEGLGPGALLIEGSRFRAVGLPVGKGRFVVSAPGYETTTLPEFEVLAERTVELGRVGVRPATELIVRVVDAAGERVRGATVRLERLPEARAGRGGLPRRLDVPAVASGAPYRLQNVPRARWRLVVEHGTAGRYRGDLDVDGPTQSVTVTLTPP